MQSVANRKKEAFNRRRGRVRAKVRGSAQRPRLNVFRSLRRISVQLIDDDAGRTLVACNDQEITAKGNKVDIASKVGELVAKKAIAAGIKQVVFDRAGYRYHGRVKALAESARTGGLQF